MGCAKKDENDEVAAAAFGAHSKNILLSICQRVY